MIAEVKNIIDGCIKRSATIQRYMSEFGSLTLDEYIYRQRQKLAANNRLTPMQDGEDFISICAGYVSERLGAEYGSLVKDALRTKALHTADHLGGLYTPQSFQGDLLFARLTGAKCIPCFAAGSVTLHSSTYGRGIQYFSKKEEIGKIPLFPGKYAKHSASLVKGIDEAAINRGLKSAASIEHAGILDRVTDILGNIYLDRQLLEQERFADQAIRIGAGIFEDLGEPFSKTPLIHIETEEVSGRLFIRDVKDKSSLVHRILYNKELVSRMGRLRERLFRGNDQKGHMFSLKLCEDGFLRGSTIYNENYAISADPDTLCEAISDRQIFISAYLRALMLAFARGFTWYGGSFQSSYLRQWQIETVSALRLAGEETIASYIESFETDGYISGPIFAMFDTGAGATPAGPVEFGIQSISEEQLDKCMKHVKVYEAHVMGMFEFYYDLFLADERIDGWYGKLASFEKDNHSDSCIMLGS